MKKNTCTAVDRKVIKARETGDLFIRLSKNKLHIHSAGAIHQEIARPV